MAGKVDEYLDKAVEFARKAEEQVTVPNHNYTAAQTYAQISQAWLAIYEVKNNNIKGTERLL